MPQEKIDQELAQAGLEPLLGSAAVCAASGGICRETLSRRVSRGDFPAPDQIVCGRNYWFASTIRRLREEDAA
jgi:hypothetical protein